MQSLFPGLASVPNLHPMFVHFPLAFWTAATAVWWWHLVMPTRLGWTFGLWLHLMGAAGGIVASVFGYLGAEALGHASPGHGMVHTHRNFMLIATAISLVIAVFGWWKRANPEKHQYILGILSVCLLGVTMMGADRGAELVYRYGTGVAMEAPPETSHGHGTSDGHEHGAGIGHEAMDGADQEPVPTGDSPPTPAPAHGGPGHSH